MRYLKNIFTTSLVVLGMSCIGLQSTTAADHLDSPSVEADGQLDLNDLYAFQSPTNPDNTVLIMTVNPLAGVLSSRRFSTSGEYRFEIDGDGDAIADVVFAIRFRGAGRQFVRVRRIANGRSRTIVSGRVGRNLSVRGGGKFRTGTFDDPFFFDLDGFNDGFNFTGTDFFAGFNVSSIVMEVPSSSLGGDNIAVWARTLTPMGQFDRMGRPAINTALIPSDMKDDFNVGDPQDDFADFGDTVTDTITALSGDATYAAMITAILLPDVLTVDTSSSAGFLNGRKLDDDVIDAELNILTNGGVTTDGVDANDKAFSPNFPYLAVRHQSL